MNRLDKFKNGLARVFDDNLHTKQWHNYVDYAIIALIIISTLQVFVSTFDVSKQFEHVLRWIDLITTITFTIEVTLRIWVADKLNPKYKGMWGRIRYIFSFYGFIDVVSTYPFYLTFWLPIPYSLLKVFRVARLFRVFRYMRSFKLLTKAFQSKKEELWVSVQFLTIVTVILSFVLFFYEHQAQPEVYDNGIVSVVWAFAQYIGDPGGFAETPPITMVGRLIACIIGVLGIAIFAVPAGLIGAGFTEAMADDKKERVIAENRKRLQSAFERKLDRPTGFQVVPQHLSICDIQARVGLKGDDIFDAVQASGCMFLWYRGLFTI